MICSEFWLSLRGEALPQLVNNFLEVLAPSLANLRASVRVLMARFFDSSVPSRFAVGQNFALRFFNQAAQCPRRFRCLAASSQIGRSVSSKWMLPGMRGKARLRLNK